MATLLYNRAMALVVFLRGVNVGGHRTFRPSILANELSGYGVVNVGAAGTFVVRKPGLRTKFRAELLSGSSHLRRKRFSVTVAILSAWRWKTHLGPSRHAPTLFDS